MPSPLRSRLIDLGAETLADALIDLAEQNKEAQALVLRLTATPEEGVKRIKAKLAGLKRSRSFVDWRGAAAFRFKLKSLLQDVEAAVRDPKQGVGLVKLFFETDYSTFNRCDDSSGYIGDIFRFDAQQLFVHYAQACQDKTWVRKLVKELLTQDGYGVRYPIIEKAHEFLPVAEIRILIEECQQAADAASEEDDDDARHWISLIQSLARQIQDAPRFEQARLQSCDTPAVPPASACVDIGAVYLESGDPQRSLIWLLKAGVDQGFGSSERDALLLKVYGQLGENGKQREIAWRLFRAGRSTNSLETLLDVIGADQWQAVVAEETAMILDEPKLTMGNLSFLIDAKQFDAAEQYLIKFADDARSHFYGHLVPCAQVLEVEAKLLGATILYRALLDDILASAHTKAYAHGARYLKKLESLAKLVSDWRTLFSHDDYLLQVRKKHGLKYSFWKRLE